MVDSTISCPITTTIDGYILRLQNIAFRCGQAERVKTSTKETPILGTGKVARFHKSHTPLCKKLNEMMESGKWDESLTALPLTCIEGKSSRDAARIIDGDARTLINFLEKVTYGLRGNAADCLCNEEKAALEGEPMLFKIASYQLFIFTMETSIQLLTEAAALALKVQESVRAHSLQSKSGGEKPKKAEPVRQAIEMFLNKQPRMINWQNKKIAEAFCNKYKENKCLEIFIGKDMYEIYSDRTSEYIFYRIAESQNRNKLNSEAKSIAYSTFVQRYISSAKKCITSLNK